ncbi:hypothetical protein [Desulfovibrio inopinatus]|uniref:hypothetical protein n=1 Tax=Desulfovibrio inopinatus TaxID=102109 RepID=UPI0012ECA3D1|nr:hypothetical protein [Desulfovibrio inopinatus]
MAVLMKEAADVRGLPNLYRKFEEIKIQLRFEANKKTYYYADGVLLEAINDRWGKIGRNINHKASTLTGDKFGTKTHLKEFGFSVPEGRFFRRRHIDRAINAFNSFRKPVCVKPNRGSLGKNVFPSIYTSQWYEYALHHVAKVKPNILVKECVTGDHFRFFYISPQIAGIRQGIPFHVIGDGITTIQDLLETKNAERCKRNLPTHPPFEMDQQSLDFLAMQNLNTEDIPPIGQKVFLYGASNGTAGADTILLDKEEVHPSYCAIVEQACKSIPGVYFAGVDIIIRDRKQPASQENHWILELNMNPSLTAFYYLWKGYVVDIAGLILDFLAEGHDFS